MTPIPRILHLGRVTAVDHTAPNPRARVRVGALETDYLQVLAVRAGRTRIACAPSVGEQVLIAAPGGRLEVGIILGSLPQEAHPAPVTAADIHRAYYPDGAVIEYDAAAHALRATLPSGASARIEAPGGITLVGNVTLTGTLAVSGNVTSQGTITATQVSAGSTALTTHVHPGVEPGGGTSGPPA